jgi:hypothetical protein
LALVAIARTIPQQRSFAMRFLIRLAVVAVVLLIAIGLYRGWFGISGPNRDQEGDKVKIGVTVDEKKIKDDIKKTKEKIGEKIGQPEDHRDTEKIK